MHSYLAYRAILVKQQQQQMYVYLSTHILTLKIVFKVMDCGSFKFPLSFFFFSFKKVLDGIER